MARTVCTGLSAATTPLLTATRRTPMSLARGRLSIVTPPRAKMGTPAS